MQKRMIEAMEAIPGVSSVGLVGQYQPLTMGGRTENVFTDKTVDIKPSNAATEAFEYNISPEYLHAAGNGFVGWTALYLA